MDTTGLNEIIHSNKNPGYEERHVTVRGNKNDTTKASYTGFPYNRITIRSVDAFYLLDFLVDGRNKLLDAQQDTIFEGYYTNRFEGYAFREIKNGRVEPIAGWTYFESSANFDSIRKNNKYWSVLQRGVYMRVKGVRQYGYHRYGHYGGWGYELNVTEILAIDTTKILNTHWARDLENGYVQDKDTIWLPKDFETGKKYSYTGNLKKFRVELELVKTEAGVIHYVLSYYKKNRRIDVRKGRMVLNVDSYVSYPNGDYKYDGEWDIASDYRQNVDLVISGRANTYNGLTLYLLDNSYIYKGPDEGLLMYLKDK